MRVHTKGAAIALVKMSVLEGRKQFDECMQKKLGENIHMFVVIVVI